MRMHCLGTAGYHPNDVRQTSCFALPQARLLLDAGSGLYRVTPLLEADDLEILITHSHLDHVAGLTFLLGVAAKHRLRRVRIWGEPQKLACLRTHLFNPLLFPVLPPWMEFCQLPAGELQLGAVMVRHVHLEHPGGTIGYRLDWNDTSLAYITDTTATPDAHYRSFIADADLLLHEANFTEQQMGFAIETGHSWTSAVAQLAAAAHVKRLVLTHFNPQGEDALPAELDVARTYFPATDLAHDGLIVDF